MKDGRGSASTATPRKNATESGGSPSSSNSRRQTRSQVAAAIVINKTEIQEGSVKCKNKFEEENLAPRTLTTDVPQSAAHDPMNRKLDFKSSESKKKGRSNQTGCRSSII
jgi:hypothetical protein